MQMLFHITHTHTEQTCPYHNEEVRDATFGQVLPAWAEAGVTVIGAWTDPPAHQMYFVIDTKDLSSVYAGLEPIIDQGTADIHAVGDFAAMVEELAERRS